MVGGAGVRGVLHVVVDGEDGFFRAVGAVLFDVLALDDREGLHDVVNVVALDSVKVEKGGIELAPDKEPTFLVPPKRRTVATAVFCEWFKVPSSVRQFQNTRQQESREKAWVTLHWPGTGLVIGERRRYRKLFEYVVFQVRASHLLSRRIVCREAVKRGCKKSDLRVATHRGEHQ